MSRDDNARPLNQNDRVTDAVECLRKPEYDTSQSEIVLDTDVVSH